MKTLILSDLHLGSGSSRAGNMLEDLRRVAGGFDRVILNGDTLDRYESPEYQIAAPWLRAVKDALQCGGGGPELLAGNHDPAISNEHYVYLSDSATLVFHGDCIADCTHPSREEDRTLMAAMGEKWSALGERPRRFKDLVHVYREVQRRHLKDHIRVCEPKSVPRYLFNVFFPPQKPFHIVRYWYRMPGLAARIAATFDQPVRNIVIGHSHFGGTWLKHGINVYNTGSFMPISRPYAAVEADGKLSFQRLDTWLRSHATTVHLPRPAEAAAAPRVNA